MLLADFGSSLRPYLKADLEHADPEGSAAPRPSQPPTGINRWHPILHRYAEVQIAAADHVDELLALGALDRRLAVLPAEYERLLADTASLLIGAPDGLTADQYARARALIPHFAAMCAELAAYGIPETLHHDDFHDGNVFLAAGRPILADWGESCVTHPFFSLLITQRSAAYTLGLTPDDPALARLRDVYLEPWTRFASPADLRRAFDLAMRVGRVNRALTWHRVVSTLPSPYREQEADAVPGWLQLFFEVAPA